MLQKQKYPIAISISILENEKVLVGKPVFCSVFFCGFFDNWNLLPLIQALGVSFDKPRSSSERQGNSHAVPC